MVQVRRRIGCCRRSSVASANTRALPSRPAQRCSTLFILTMSSRTMLHAPAHCRDKGGPACRTSRPEARVQVREFAEQVASAMNIPPSLLGCGAIAMRKDDEPWLVGSPDRLRSGTRAGDADQQKQKRCSRRGRNTSPEAGLGIVVVITVADHRPRKTRCSSMRPARHRPKRHERFLLRSISAAFPAPDYAGAFAPVSARTACWRPRTAGQETRAVQEPKQKFTRAKVEGAD